ncbi:hypothetical protein L1049_018025 [Liquidambar formosana]|uniref:Uncharacterized protein n=1 Tax=Liquidambar formosana TaxID=63359 RepID=A0AAP0NID4_LIQFO
MATTLLLLPLQQTLFFPSKPNLPIPNPNKFHHRYHHHHHHHHHHDKQRSIPKIPFSTSPFRNGRTPSETECPVPLDQQPINEYQNLSNSFPFSWASGDLGLPVAWFGTVGPDSEPLKLVLGAVSSGILVVTLAVLRMYLGWAYVGNRLLSATVEYEETGWYDGQIWVKTAEVLARDRLLGSFSVKPVLGRLKFTLVSLAASLFVCVLLLIDIEGGQKDFYLTSEEAGGRAIPGVYKDESARSFEPDAFCGEPGVP